MGVHSSFFFVNFSFGPRRERSTSSPEDRSDPTRAIDTSSTEGRSDFMSLKEHKKLLSQLDLPKMDFLLGGDLGETCEI